MGSLVNSFMHPNDLRGRGSRFVEEPIPRGLLKGEYRLHREVFQVLYCPYYKHRRNLNLSSAMGSAEKGQPDVRSPWEMTPWEMTIWAEPGVAPPPLVSPLELPSAVEWLALGLVPQQPSVEVRWILRVLPMPGPGELA